MRSTNLLLALSSLVAVHALHLWSCKENNFKGDCTTMPVEPFGKCSSSFSTTLHYTYWNHQQLISTTVVAGTISLPLCKSIRDMLAYFSSMMPATYHFYCEIVFFLTLTRNHTCGVLKNGGRTIVLKKPGSGYLEDANFRGVLSSYICYNSTNWELVSFTWYSFRVTIPI